MPFGSTLARMKNFSLHTPSALAGAVILGLVLLAMGIAQSSSFDARVSMKGPVQVIGQPAARDIVTIVEGVPYTVPAGRMIVITAYGTSTGINEAFNVLVDGSQAMWADVGTQGEKSSYRSIPSPGLVAGSGSVVDVVCIGACTNTDGRLWGYLEPE